MGRLASESRDQRSCLANGTKLLIGKSTLMCVLSTTQKLQQHNLIQGISTLPTLGELRRIDMYYGRGIPNAPRPKIVREDRCAPYVPPSLSFFKMSIAFVEACWLTFGLASAGLS
jgi:hypothetical protein